MYVTGARRLFLVLGALCGCDQAPEEASVGLPIPEKACAEAAQSLKTLAQSGAVEPDGLGNATIETALWLQMDADSKDSFASALALAAACKADVPPLEQQVVITSEWGDVLMRRVVQVSTEASLDL